MARYSIDWSAVVVTILGLVLCTAIYNIGSLAYEDGIKRTEREEYEKRFELRCLSLGGVSLDKHFCVKPGSIINVFKEQQ